MARKTQRTALRRNMSKTGMRTSHGQLPALQWNEDQDVTELLSLLTRIVDRS